MIDNKNTVYHAKSSVLDLIFRILGITISIFLLYFSSLNPVFFFLCSGAILFFALVYPTTHIVVKNDSFNIYRKNFLFPIIYKKTAIVFSKVVSINYYPGNWVSIILALILPYFFTGNSFYKRIRVCYNDGRSKNFDIRGVNSKDIRICIQKSNGFILKKQ